MRPIVLLITLSACGPSAGVLIDEGPLGDSGDAPAIDTALGDGWTDEAFAWSTEEEEPDYSAYEDAYVRIVSPVSNTVIPVGEPQTYTVELRSPEGIPLSADGVTWQSSIDVDFGSSDLSFEYDNLDPGLHTLTALVDLPNGSRLAHSVSGIRVQDAAAGTYTGLFSVDGTVNNITITCTGAAEVAFGALGFVGEGDASCLISLLGVDLPMTWLFELEHVNGVVTGTGGVNLLGLFTYDIPVTGGTLEPTGNGLRVDFAGPIPFIGELSAFLDARRVSLDPLQ